MNRSRWFWVTGVLLAICTWLGYYLWDRAHWRLPPKVEYELPQFISTVPIVVLYNGESIEGLKKQKSQTQFVISGRIGIDPSKYFMPGPGPYTVAQSRERRSPKRRPSVSIVLRYRFRRDANAKDTESEVHYRLENAEKGIVEFKQTFLSPQIPGEYEMVFEIAESRNSDYRLDNRRYLWKGMITVTR